MTGPRRALLAVTAVALVAGGLRVYALSSPHEKVFDEVYYASDGCLYAGHPYRECDLETDVERSWVHPPLGKQIIAIGIEAFGNRPFGWRIASAVAGTATVALIAVLAYLLFGSALVAGAAGILAATEHLLFVQSRIAMLDVFLALFVVLAFVLVVWDRVRMERAAPARPDVEDPVAEPSEQPPHIAEPVPLPPRPWIRPLQLAAGVAFGLAMAVKWSGYLALAGGAVLAGAWTIRRIVNGDGRLREFFGLAVSFGLVPFVVYVLPWIPWLSERSFDVGELFGHHGEMLEYHRDLDSVKDDGEPIHPYMSRAWSWFLLLRPVAYYWDGDTECCREILGIGNPFLFWGGIIVVVYLALVWVTRREWQAGAILLPILFQFLPWLLVSRPLFLFYMTPVTPFLALGMAYPVRDILAARIPRPLAIPLGALFVVVSVGLFAFFWPVLTASRIPQDAWQARMWFPGWV